MISVVNRSHSHTTHAKLLVILRRVQNALLVLKVMCLGKLTLSPPTTSSQKLSALVVVWQSLCKGGIGAATAPASTTCVTSVSVVNELSKFSQ